MRKKIFILLSRVPYPLEKGDKLRAFYQIRELAKNHDVYLCALNDSPVHPEAQKILLSYVKDMRVFTFSKLQVAFRLIKNIFSNKPFQVAYFYSRQTKNKINKYLAEVNPDHVYCQLIRMAEYTIHLDIDKTLDYQDAFSAGLLRRKKYASWIIKPFLTSEYNRVRKYEEKMANHFIKKTIISIPDRNLISSANKEEIQIIPNGVDYDFFDCKSTEKKFDVIFCGNMAYPPNDDAACFLIQEIMPLVWSSLPDAKVVIAGANPTGRIRRLASPQVTITGWVDDVRLYYSASKIMVAPLRIGTGLQNKILEAMAMKVPVIASHHANQAVRANHGEQILTAETQLEFAQQILSLLNNDSLYNHLIVNGLSFVKDHYDWSTPCKLLEKIITTPGFTGNS